MENTAKLKQAKNAILDAIIKTSDTGLGSNAEAFANAYEALTRAETQERMIALATTPCDCLRRNTGDDA